MKSEIKKNRKVIDFLYNFKNIVKKEKWVPRYDKDVDAFSFSVPILSKNARISYLDDEIAFYFNKNGEIEGIFIEYFTANFVRHHKELKELLKDIEKEEKKDNKSLIQIETVKSQNIFPKFEEVIKSSLLENFQFQKTDVN